MHGVGGRFVVEALAHFGYRNVAPVPEQYDPDGRFPTVAFPNPEEQGALDLATAQAERDGSDLIIANDPDTDRLAVSVPRPGEGWRPLTGNQVGVLLADFILTHGTVPDPIVINSIVSSPMLAAVAEHHGAGFAQTLTGFKWIWNAALELEAAGEGHFVFGYEEALGYSVSRQVRDKDGISAAVVFADLAADARAAGTTVLGRLEDLYRRHGVWVSTQENVVRPGTEGATEIAHAMLQLAEYPPTEVGGYRVVGGNRLHGRRRAAALVPRRHPAAGARPRRRRPGADTPVGHRAEAQGVRRPGRPCRRRSTVCGGAVAAGSGRHPRPGRGRPARALRRRPPAPATGRVRAPHRDRHNGGDTGRSDRWIWRDCSATKPTTY